MSRVGFVLAVLLFSFVGNASANDWMSMVQPADYFKSRNIEPTIDRMIDFAIADIDSAKAQIRQLAAIQHLINESNTFKKAPNYETNRMAIEEVAAAKRGKDPAGFGQQYAKRLIAKLDGEKPAPPTVQPIRADALNWFPANTKFAGAFDMQQLQDISNSTQKNLLSLLSSNARFTFYDQLEISGNLCMDRIAFGIVDAEKRDDAKTLIRVTGFANQTWIANLITSQAGDFFETTKSKADDGTPIITLRSRHGGATFALVGNTDVIIGAYHGFTRPHDEVLAEMLAVRAKKKPHATDGAVKDRLAKIPDKAVGFLVGDLPGEFKNEIGHMVDPIPTKIAAYVERNAMGLELKAEAVMKDGGEAGKLVGKVAALGKDGIKGLQQAMKEPPQPGMPIFPYPALIKTLETIQVQNQGEKVLVSSFVANSLIQQLNEAFIAYNNSMRNDDFRELKK